MHNGFSWVLKDFSGALKFFWVGDETLLRGIEISMEWETENFSGELKNFLKL